MQQVSPNLCCHLQDYTSLHHRRFLSLIYLSKASLAKRNAKINYKYAEISSDTNSAWIFLRKSQTI
jgi:hypothetical protein